MFQDPLFAPDIMLEVSAVSKKFSYSLANARKYGSRDLMRSMLGLVQADGHLRKGEFWAVRDISFQLKQGETLGIIGLNGSGKSTILKMINGLYMPDEGEIRMRGQVGALIELGAGFHPMYSGKENVYIKGALLGKSKEEMDEIYQQIADFAELGAFIDSPIKTYSSGMHVRLGFAVSIFMEPNILLMDEVLAVGDFRFRQKCLDKINQMREHMSTIFVSHSMGTVLLFCDRVIVLNKGMIAYEGSPENAIKYYTYEIENNKKKNQFDKAKDAKPFYGDLFINEDKICNVDHYWADENMNKIEFAETGSEVNIVVRFQLLKKPIRTLVVGIPIWNNDGLLITSLGTDMNQVELNGDENNRYEIILNFQQLTFNPNEYISTIAIVDGLEYYYRGLNNTLFVIGYKRNAGLITATHRWIN